MEKGMKVTKGKIFLGCQILFIFATRFDQRPDSLFL
jgi:hypothetical protein